MHGMHASVRLHAVSGQGRHGQGKGVAKVLDCLRSGPFGSSFW